MLKYLWIFVLMFFFLSNVFALKFDLSMDGPFTGGNIVNVKLDKPVDSLKMYYAGKQFLFHNKKSNTYQFVIPNGLLPDSRIKHIKFVVKTGTKIENYILDKYFPTLYTVDVIDVKGGDKVKLNLVASGSCSIIFSNGQKQSLSFTNGSYYLSIPKTIPTDIKGGYVTCNKLSSNYVKFYIPASPKLDYLISEDKKAILPGKKVYLVGENIRLNADDEVKLLLNGKEIPFTFKNNNTLVFTLPYKNLVNASLQVVRNNFISNQLKFSAKIVPYITSISTNLINNRSYFVIYGKFDFNLGDLKITYNNKNLSVDHILKSKDISQIYISYPELSNNKDTFTCSYYVLPGNFKVSIGGVDSNIFYYKPDYPIQILSVEDSNCNDIMGCYLKLRINKNINDKNYQFYVNGQKVDFSSVSNELTLFTKNLVTKGKIYYQTKNCLQSLPFYFDFTKKLKPIITQISSPSNFRSQSKFTIEGDRFYNFKNQDLQTKANFSPDVVENLVYSYSIKGNIKYGIPDATKVNVKVHTIFGDSNSAYFVVNGKNKYLAAPIINQVSFENGALEGDSVEINGLNFSENCSENKIYLDNQVVYPEKCSFNSLIFKVPQALKFSKIKVEVGELESNSVQLPDILGGVGAHKFEFLAVNKIDSINITKNNSFSFDIPFVNTKSELFLPKLVFNLSNIDIVPFDSVILSVNGNDYKYQLNFQDHKVEKTTDKNIAYVVDNYGQKELVFNNIFLPFSSNEQRLTLKFILSKSLVNNTIFTLSLKPGTYYYYNVFSPQTAKTLKIDANVKDKIIVLNPQQACVDSSSDYSHCALALQTKDGLVQTSNFQKKEATYVNYQHKSLQKPKKLTKQEKIAQGLTFQKMQLLNKVIKNFLVEEKKKYWGTPKIWGVVEMYKAYKGMEEYTSNNYSDKLKYVDYLIQFAKAYFAFIKK